MADNPKNYSLDAEVAGVIWAALFEAGDDELARLRAETMIAQGCQELVGVSDSSLILMFWKNHLVENGYIAVRPGDKELN